MFSVKALVLVSALSAQGDSQLLHFSATWCQPCREMEPVVARLEQEGHTVRHVDVDRQRQLAQRYGVNGVPCFVMLQSGQEIDRVVGQVSYARLQRMFQVARGPRGTAQRQAGQIRGQSPEPRRLSSGVTNTLGALPRLLGRGESAGPIRGRGSAEPRRAQTVPISPASHARGMNTPQPRPNTAAGPMTSQDPRARALAATVRLRIDDEQGRSYGTGTIIDAHNDEALVVTCGHIFRDSGGKGSISVDLFHPESREPLPGTLVSYDLDRDVGLVSIRLPVPVAPVPVAGVGYRIQTGQPVFSMGCDRGADPSELKGRVNSVNRYSGPPNLSVSGQPIDGRSGGGLFSSEGVLIGVCNAADPQDDEGLYAAAGTVHAELDRSGLGFVYRRNGASLAQGTSDLPTTQPVRESETRGVRPPQMPTLPRTPPGPFSAPSVDDSEVICIVRSRSNPDAPSQVFLLDQPSTDFMARLAHETGGAGSASGTHTRDARADAIRGDQNASRPGRPRTATPIIRGQTR